MSLFFNTLPKKQDSSNYSLQIKKVESLDPTFLYFLNQKNPLISPDEPSCEGFSC